MRELQVLQLVVQGKSNQEIAEELVVALSTVKAHTNSIYSKLDVIGRGPGNPPCPRPKPRLVVVPFQPPFQPWLDDTPTTLRIKSPL